MIPHPNPSSTGNLPPPRGKLRPDPPSPLNICPQEICSKNVRLLWIVLHFPADTCRLYNVASTSRHNVASTLMRRCLHVACPLGLLFLYARNIDIKLDHNFTYFFDIYLQSASLYMTFGLFPPSSSVTLFRFDFAAACIINCPT